MALGAGLTRKQPDRLVREREVRRVLHGVYLRTDVPDTQRNGLRTKRAAATGAPAVAGASVAPGICGPATSVRSRASW